MTSQKVNISLALIALTWIWVGLTTGLSFIEAPIKFQAPGITLPLGLGIGRLVFGVLVKIEFAFSILTIAALLNLENRRRYWLYVIPIAISIVDYFYLLGRLDQRAQIIIDGGIPPESSMHMIYIMLECIKLIALIICGVKLLRDSTTKTDI